MGNIEALAASAQLALQINDRRALQAPLRRAFEAHAGRLSHSSNAKPSFDLLRELGAGRSLEGTGGGINPSDHSEVVRCSLLYAALLVFEEELMLTREDRSHPHEEMSLSAEDRAIVDALYLYESGVAFLDISLLGCIQDWQDVALRLQRGPFDDSLDEYFYLLRSRDLIAEAAAIVSSSGLRLLADALDPTDRQFKARTRALSSPVSERGYRWSRSGWWWYRIPSKSGPRFERDLNAWRGTTH